MVNQNHTDDIRVRAKDNKHWIKSTFHHQCRQKKTHRCVIYLKKHNLHVTSLWFITHTCKCTSDRSDLFSSSKSLSFFCRESSGKKVGVDTVVSLRRTLETHMYSRVNCITLPWGSGLSLKWAEGCFYSCHLTGEPTLVFNVQYKRINTV